MKNPFSRVERPKLSRIGLIGNLIIEVFDKQNVSRKEALEVLEKLYQLTSQYKE